MLANRDQTPAGYASDAATNGRHLKLQPELRRSAWYVIIGGAIIIPTGVWISRAIVGGPVVDAVASAVFLSLLPLAMVVALRWSIYVDIHGVARRRLLWWDWWTWQDFASGRIRKGNSHVFIDPARPWWRRKLNIGYLAGGDRKALVELINAQYRFPPPPELPEEIAVKYGIRRRAVFSARGIALTLRGDVRQYGWDEVQRVHVTRVDLVRRDFKQLVVELPEREIAFRLASHQGGTTPTWSGASAEEINEYLARHVADDRIDVDIAGERPSRRQDVEKMLATAAKNLREWDIVTRIMGLVFAAGVIWMGIDDGWFTAVVFGVMYGVLLGPVAWMLRRVQIEQIEKYKSWLAEFDDVSRVVNGKAD